MICLTFLFVQTFKTDKKNYEVVFL